MWLHASITTEALLVYFSLFFRLEKVYNLLKEHLTPKKQETQSGKWICVWIVLKQGHISVFLGVVVWSVCF